MNASWRMAVILGAGCCLVVSGCDPVHNSGPKFMGGDRISARTRWVVMGDLRNPHYAIDGSVGTAAVSTADYQNASLNIDLGKVCLFNMVTLDHGTDELGYCGKVAVLTSDDGKTFRRQIVIPGLRRVTTIVLIKPVLSRYLRLQAVVPGPRPWSIAEIYLD